jgi:hypothetical protein
MSLIRVRDCYRQICGNCLRSVVSTYLMDSVSKWAQ